MNLDPFVEYIISFSPCLFAGAPEYLNPVFFQTSTTTTNNNNNNKNLLLLLLLAIR